MRKTQKKTNRYFNQAIGLEPTTKYDKEDSSFYNRDCCLCLSIRKFLNFLIAKKSSYLSVAYGLQIECEDVEPERLAEFSHVLAGYCDADLYDTWINDGNGESHKEPTMNI